MTDALSELTGRDLTDPDAQATITDFADYTEFFPSDLIRSLTLIGSLDQAYQEDTQTIHEFTKTYGCLPTLPVDVRPEPRAIRKQISVVLDHALRAREATYLEASRLCDNANRLYDRLVGIKQKLEAMPKPPSRDPTPDLQSRSPALYRSKKPDNDRTARLSLYAGHNRQHSPPRRGRPRKLTSTLIYPGQVLPPLDLYSPGESESSDYETSDGESTVAPPLTGSRKEKVAKVPKLDKIKLPKIPKVRQPGSMGTNVHSIVAGISTSNAIALLEKPPEGALPGSKHRPWLKLTEYEMAMLRKKMKKNAIWHPSSTMVRRELASRGRGIENYKNAKAHSDATGEPFIDEDPLLTGSTTLAPGEMTLSASEMTITNRGMRLNEAKKIKRENLLKEQAVRDAMEQAARDAREIEMAGQRIANAGLFVQDLFNRSSGEINDAIRVNHAQAKRKEKSKHPKKRKSDSGLGVESNNIQTPQPPPAKKLKLIPPATIATSNKLVLIPPAPSDSSASTPKGKEIPTRSTRTAPAKIVNGNAADEFEDTPIQHTTRHSTRVQPPTITLKLKTPTSTEPTSRKASLRHSENTSGFSTPQLTTPSSDTPSSTVKSNKTMPAKRALPKPSAKATTVSSKKNKQNALDPAVPDDIDPDEPRYCICGGVSWGDMVGCDNDNCKMEWFHWDCVGLTESPGRREKWYCPDCQKSLKVDVHGVPMKKHKGLR